jgi:hypothetical protein
MKVFRTKGENMRTAFFLTLPILLAASALAQDAQTSSPPQTNIRTVEGCLTKTNGQYVITGGAPGPKQFRIIGGDTSALKGQIEHTVAVTGPVGVNDAEANMTEPYNEGTTTGVGWNTIVAQKIKLIYGNCSEPGKESAAGQP